MKDKTLRDNLAFMLKELRKSKRWISPRGTKQASVYDKSGMNTLCLKIYKQSDLTKATLEDLLKDCKSDDYITVEEAKDYEDCFDGYWVSVMRLVKEDDSAYYRTILDDYNYLKGQDNMTKVKMKVQTLGLNLTEYQVNQLAKVFKEND